MYNAERKEQFLTERKEKAILSNNIANLFDLSGPTESELGRDLCEWNSDEILTFYKYYSTPSVQSLIQMHNSLTMYTNWCISNGMVTDNQNHYTEINSTMLCDCVNIPALRKTLFSRNEIESLIRQLPNYADAFLLLALFEGVPTKCLFDLKVSDFDENNNLHLSNGNVIEASYKLKYYAEMGAEEDTRESIPHGKKEFRYEYTDGDHIIRHIKRNNVRQNETIIIGLRMRKAGEYLDAPNITMKSLSESGRMWFIGKMIQDGMTLEEAVVDHRPDHEAVYGRIQNAKTYLNIYGKIIMEMYGG